MQIQEADQLVVSAAGAVRVGARVEIERCRDVKQATRLQAGFAGDSHLACADEFPPLAPAPDQAALDEKLIKPAFQGCRPMAPRRRMSRAWRELP